MGLKDVFVSLLDLVRTEAVVDEAPNHFVALHGWKNKKGNETQGSRKEGKKKEKEEEGEGLHG